MTDPPYGMEYRSNRRAKRFDSIAGFAPHRGLPYIILAARAPPHRERLTPMIALASTVSGTRCRPGRAIPTALLLLSLVCFLPVSVSAAKAESDLPFVDAHTHLSRGLSDAGGGGRKGRGGRGASASLSSGATVSTALAVMNRFGVSYAILAPPPLPSGREEASNGIDELQAVVRQNPTRFAFSAGGESLNPLIQSTPPGNVTPNLLRRFQQEAEAIAEAGAAAFGELAAEHFSSHIGNHPYESVRPDHPLFLALADIAAKYDMPIELHMEAVPRDMPFPDAKIAGPPNPTSIVENIAAFERLLDHNQKARIVWVHAGWDHLGRVAASSPIGSQCCRHFPTALWLAATSFTPTRRSSGPTGRELSWMRSQRKSPIASRRRT